MDVRRRGRRGLSLLAASAILGLGVFGVYSWFSSSTDEDEELLYERFWMTEMPDQEREYTHEFYITRSAPYGLFLRASMFRLEEEIFEYQAEGRRLSLTFPQDGRQASLEARVSRCDDHPPFDLCLELSENPWGGPRRYFSFADEEEQSRRASPQLRRRAEALGDLPQR